MKKYVAVSFSFDSRTNKVECTAQKDMTITGENGASVTLNNPEAGVPSPSRGLGGMQVLIWGLGTGVPLFLSGFCFLTIR